MGDFSRNTFAITNAMHQLLTGQAVANPRHYVGVRLQQGVPLLDSDWNELEDIRNLELRAILHFFIGNGAPANNQGFAISENGIANSFAIGGGVILQDGLLVINLGTLAYTAQTEGGPPAPLTTPGAGADRTDIVYLDIWHDFIPGTGTGSDGRIVNPQIGIETALRIARRWSVRVREGATNLVGLPVPAGHLFLPLALFERLAGVANIRDSMIIDLRRRGITLSENLKVPINLRRGLEVLDIIRFSAMTRSLRSTLFERLRTGALPYQTGGANAARDERVLLMSLQEVMGLGQIGEMQSSGRAMDNTDALRFMNDLYAAQDSFLDLLAGIGNVGNTAQAFIDGYRARLDGNAAQLIKGLQPALAANDLLNAVIAQEDLNLWLTSAIDNLPEGAVDAVYLATVPFENLTTNAAGYDVTYRIRATFTSPQPTEEFRVQVTLPAAFGTAAVNTPILTFAPPQQETVVTVHVVLSGGTPTGTLDVSAFAVRNATLRSSQPGIALVLGAPPPVGAFFYYAGPRLNAAGRLEIPQVHLTRPQGRNILYRLTNTNATQTRTYSVTRRIVPNVGDTTGWTPLADTAATGSPFTLNPNTQSDVLARVDGPKAPAPAPPVGTTGDIVASAVLTLIDGTPPVDPQTPVTVTIPFIVV